MGEKSIGKGKGGEPRDKKRGCTVVERCNIYLPKIESYSRPLHAS